MRRVGLCMTRGTGGDSRPRGDDDPRMANAWCSSKTLEPLLSPRIPEKAVHGAVLALTIILPIMLTETLSDSALQPGASRAAFPVLGCVHIVLQKRDASLCRSLPTEASSVFVRSVGEAADHFHRQWSGTTDPTGPLLHCDLHLFRFPPADRTPITHTDPPTITTQRHHPGRSEAARCIDSAYGMLTLDG